VGLAEPVALLQDWLAKVRSRMATWAELESRSPELGVVGRC